MIHLLPAWTQRGSAKELEEAIGNGFRFQGAGLYLRSFEFDLVLQETDPDATTNTHARFAFHHYDCPLEETVLMNLPPLVEDSRIIK